MKSGAMVRTIFLISLLAVLWAPAWPPASATGTDEAPGQRFEVTLDDLPAPYVTDSAVNFPQTIPREPGDTLRVPDGFEVSIFAEGLKHPRWFAIAPNGDVLVSEPDNPFRRLTDLNYITLLRDSDGDGVADLRSTFAGDFKQPHGIAFSGGYVLVADTVGVWQLAYEEGDLTAGDRIRLTAKNALGERTGFHWTRNVIVNPNGDGMLVTVGSMTNTAEDPAPHATVQSFDLSGGTQTTFASGLRNPIGIDIYPDTNDIYVVVNERDGLGDQLVPDYLTRVDEGAFYGWPYAYGDGVPDPDLGTARPDLVEKTVAPDLLFESHSAPIGLVFYDGEQFPDDYRGDAFVALHGSWNANKPTGYKVVRVKFEQGRPVGWYDNFAVGFWKEGDDRAKVWGRPAGLAIAPDGSLLIADDTGGTIWRVTYKGQ